MLSDLSVLLAAFLLSFCLTLSFSLRRPQNGRGLIQVQDVHLAPTSRLGGLAIILSCSVFVSYLHIRGLEVEFIFPLLIFSLLAGATGIMDDVRRHISPYLRAIAIFLVSVFAGVYLGWLDRLNIALLDPLIQSNSLVAAFITVFCVIGLTNSFNLIDGLNGLCGGTALIILLSLCALARILGIYELIIFYEILFCCLLGFFLINFPFGKIFLGDGGAYFLGFAIAQGSIFLNSIQSEVSSWTFVLICIYPISETLFTLGRRLILGSNWSSPDRQHLHQLMYDSLKDAGIFASDLQCNAVASALCLLFPATAGALSFLFYTNSLLLQLVCLFMVFVYMTVYFVLMKIRKRRFSTRLPL